MVSEMMMSTYAMCCTACAFFKSSDMTKVCTYQDAFEKTGNATFIETATTLKESWVWPDARARYAYAAAVESPPCRSSPSCAPRMPSCSRRSLW